MQLKIHGSHLTHKVANKYLNCLQTSGCSREDLLSLLKYIFLRPASTFGDNLKHLVGLMFF